MAINLSLSKLPWYSQVAAFVALSLAGEEGETGTRFRLALPTAEPGPDVAPSPSAAPSRAAG